MTAHDACDDAKKPRRCEMHSESMKQRRFGLETFRSLDPGGELIAKQRAAAARCNHAEEPGRGVIP